MANSVATKKRGCSRIKRWGESPCYFSRDALKFSIIWWLWNWISLKTSWVVSRHLIWISTCFHRWIDRKWLKKFLARMIQLFHNRHTYEVTNDINFMKAIFFITVWRLRASVWFFLKSLELYESLNFGAPLPALPKCKQNYKYASKYE